MLQHHRRGHFALRARRRGAIVVLFALILVVLLAFVAFAVDLGYVCAVKGDLQAAADAGALAGTGMILESEDAAVATAKRFAISNFNNQGVNAGLENNIEVQIGHWNIKKRRFEPGAKPRDAVKVTTTANESPLFVGRAMGANLVKSQAFAIATYRPRDIMLVLDVSGSMQEAHNDIRKIDELREAVTVFLNQIRQARAQDRVGFTHYSTQAHVGERLNVDLDEVERELMKRLFPHGWTNISDGMMLARKEMEKHRRNDASPLIIVLTDGAANTLQPENIQDIPEAKRRVIVEANLAKEAGIPVFTISLDSLTTEVDVDLMHQVATITKSESFHVIAGETGASGDLQLEEAFRRIAKIRPLRLVQ